MLKLLLKSTIILLLFCLKLHASDFGTDFNSKLENYNSKLTIFEVNDKKIAEFNVQKAISKKEQAYGLMNLKKLPQNYGMIFIFKKPQKINMWMKNTYIPLDMIFIDKNNIIVNIVANTTPHSKKLISSQFKVKKILEINANLAKLLNIKIGQKIKLN